MKPKPNGELKIEKGIPLTQGWSRDDPLTKALRTMEVGDSFLLPERPRGNKVYGRFAPKKFATRAVSGGGYRIWRIA